MVASGSGPESSRFGPGDDGCWGKETLGTGLLEVVVDTDESAAGPTVSAQCRLFERALLFNSVESLKVMVLSIQATGNHRKDT